MTQIRNDDMIPIAAESHRSRTNASIRNVKGIRIRSTVTLWSTGTFLLFSNVHNVWSFHHSTSGVCSPLHRRSSMLLGTDVPQTKRSTRRYIHEGPLATESGTTKESGLVGRREALLTATATASLVFLQASTPPPSSAMDTLEDLHLGTAQWTQTGIDQPSASASASASAVAEESATIVPPAFATYATRFLIRYDEGASSWWENRVDAYSLLTPEDTRDRLDQDFGGMARSVQIALEEYVGIGTGSSSSSSLDATERFGELANVFVDSYGKSTDGTIDASVIRQIAILFVLLPPELQPVTLLKQLTEVANETRKDQRHDPTNSIADYFTQLLPSKYHTNFDTRSNSFTITPSNAALYEPPSNTNTADKTLSTAFGPLSTSPLKRQLPVLPLSIYSLFGISGAAGCAITHTLVIPFDVVKTRLQTNPDRYTNVVDGALRIAQTEGISAFSLGGQATTAGYLWYGLTVYPSYAFFKWYMESSLFSAAFATAHANDIALVAGALAAVIASIGLTPMEACRIRTVAEPETYRDIGLWGTLGVIATEDPRLGWKRLYAGFSSLLVRQVTFGSVKFLAFERACDAIYQLFPNLRAATVTALGVSLAGGAFSGALSSVVSQPADSVLTYVSKNDQVSEEEKGGGDDDGRTKVGLLENAKLMVEEEGTASLFRGLGSRCLWASMIISGQFFLYDIFRNFFGINSEDLTQVLQVFIDGQNVAVS